jgi:hypothetical protein
MILKRQIVWEIIILALLVAILDKIAMLLFLYWTTAWADIVMHFLGGYLIATIAIFIFFMSGWIKFPRTKLVGLITIISTVLIVGLGWELWELFTGLTDVIIHKGDTILDLIMDILGALGAYITHKKIYE